MQPNTHDLALLEDMRKAAHLLVEQSIGREKIALENDPLYRAGVERWEEIIGEAARGISAEFSAAHPEIPWRKIIATRHIMAHDYGSINPDILWGIVTINAPELLKQLSHILPSQ
ncbi:MAG TPA: HepT-like ribonuclease domain-containing protein [Phycisphaerae bacterium]|nr:HepT-like ribonuclease domain-containing protein [Phycisphaerae bacterium]